MKRKCMTLLFALVMACLLAGPAYGTGQMVTDELWLNAMINTEEKGPVEAIWKKGGEGATAAGDRVIWGYFYASPDDVSWGSQENPDVFVKIWFDRSGRLDVNYFHVSVPEIEVSSDYPYNGEPDQHGVTTMTRRYIRQYYGNGQSDMDEKDEDGNPLPVDSPTGSPLGYSCISGLKIGSLINTVEKGPVEGRCHQGGEATTGDGHTVIWGYFYASPDDVDWGNENNPDVFVKIWFDASGRIDVNFFHVSVPDIEVYSDHPGEGDYDNKGTTTLANRYIRHEYQQTADTAPTFAVFSDPHYYDTDLGVTGEAFESYLAHDRKLLRESSAIIDATIESILSNNAIDFVMVPGDLTKDGELSSHQKFASRMKTLEDSGVQVYIVPGNHDVNNPHAYSYDGADQIPTENVSPDKFAQIYADYGYGEAIYRDPNSLSYVVEPVPGLWLFGMDACRYDENEALETPVVAGRFPGDTLDWIVDKLHLAQAENKKVMGMMHHGLVEHYTGQSQVFSEYVIEDWENVSKTLAEAGLPIVFTGHYHAQDVTTQVWEPDGKTISLTDVETGSLATYPIPYRVVTLSGDNADIQSRFVTEVSFDTGDMSFPEYAKAYLDEGLDGLALYTLTSPEDQGGYGLPPALAALIAPQIAGAFKAHYAGDESPSPDILAQVNVYLESEDPTISQLAQSLYALWNDLPPADTTVTIDLNGSEPGAVNIRPDFITGEILKKEYDGDTDDLLTAGLGKDGLAGQAPGFSDPETPTAEELRKLAVYNNYRAIVDTSPGSGYGEFYGPNVGSEGHGKISGKEYLAYADDGTGKQNVTLMVQIPSAFDLENACIVTAPSSGSRGIYGAIGSAGEWGLKRGCAVAYTDKGTGMGVHDLDTNTVNLITGERADADAAGKDSNFTAEVDSEFVQENPHTVAFKHAHSEQNPEKDWGLNVLQSIKFAFYVLNLEDNYGNRQDDGSVLQTITPENTIVIASSISNGGGASVRAAEQDTEHLIDGVAVSEPNVSPAANESLIIRQGDEEWAYPNHGRSLLDYYTLLNIYQPCANLAPGIKEQSPFNTVDEELGKNRCASLKDKGLLDSETLEDQAEEAQEKINAYGILEEQNTVQPSHYAFYVVESIAVTYANTYGRFSVADNLCGFSFAAADPETNKPTALNKILLATMFGAANGIPPTNGVTLINNDSQDGPFANRVSVSSSGARDMNLDGALCLRSLATGTDASGESLAGELLEQHERVADGISEIHATGDLHGLPTVIVHGRNDAVLPPNHTSRAYFGLNRMVEGVNSNLHYYEITNAHHLDAFNAFPGFNSAYIPLHHYYIESLDLMYEHLRNGAALPPCQLVRTMPRGMNEDGSVPGLTEENLPAIADNPADEDRIIFTDGTTVRIPE